MPVKFRYPFFQEIHWYAIERYVSVLTTRVPRSRAIDEEMEMNRLVKQELDEYEEEYSEERSSEEEPDSDSDKQGYVIYETDGLLSMRCDMILLALHIP